MTPEQIEMQNRVRIQQEIDNRVRHHLEAFRFEIAEKARQGRQEELEQRKKASNWIWTVVVVFVVVLLFVAGFVYFKSKQTPEGKGFVAPRSDPTYR
jgi:uncharacterized membrane protein